MILDLTFSIFFQENKAKYDKVHKYCCLSVVQCVLHSTVQYDSVRKLQAIISAFTFGSQEPLIQTTTSVLLVK